MRAKRALIRKSHSGTDDLSESSGVSWNRSMSYSGYSNYSRSESGVTVFVARVTSINRYYCSYSGKSY